MRLLDRRKVSARGATVLALVIASIIVASVMSYIVYEVLKTLKFMDQKLNQQATNEVSLPSGDVSGAGFKIVQRYWIWTNIESTTLAAPEPPPLPDLVIYVGISNEVPVLTLAPKPSSWSEVKLNSLFQVDEYGSPVASLVGPIPELTNGATVTTVEIQSSPDASPTNWFPGTKIDVYSTKPSALIILNEHENRFFRGVIR